MRPLEPSPPLEEGDQYKTDVSHIFKYNRQGENGCKGFIQKNEKKF